MMPIRQDLMMVNDSPPLPPTPNLALVEDPSIYLFTYGTLRKDGSRPATHYQGAEYVSPGFHTGLLKMVDLGPYPALVPSDTPYTVLGDVWRVQDLKYFDLYEGYPTLYDRKQIPIQTPNGELICWVYYMSWRKQKFSGPERVIQGGDWIQYWNDRTSSKPSTQTKH